MTRLSSDAFPRLPHAVDIDGDSHHISNLPHKIETLTIIAACVIVREKASKENADCANRHHIAVGYFL
jgi:hypothetical protein